MSEEIKEVKVPELTLEGIEKFLNENEDGKKWMQSKLDSYTTKGLATYKTNFMEKELPKLLNDEITKRYPAETESDKKLRELELKFQESEKDKHNARLQSKLLKVANESKIPDFFVDYAIDKDEESSITRLKELGTKYTETVNSSVEARMAEFGRKAPINADKIDLSNLALDSLPNDDPEFYTKNAEAVSQLMKK